MNRLATPFARNGWLILWTGGHLLRLAPSAGASLDHAVQLSLGQYATPSPIG